jgi:phospholipid/cholesterol/gamma-HCH transport system ATP-binding protein
VDTAEPLAELDSVSVAFGRREVFRELSVGFPRGQLTMLMGPSGCGKSTILRLLGGLIRPTTGRVVVADEEISSVPEREMTRVRSQLGMLFQSGALLDSLTVFDNIALPLREHSRLGAAEIRDAVRARLEAVGLYNAEDLLPGELSGGMLRRAALARAIIRDPQILLCDEPFSGLDPPNVRRVEGLLRRMCSELKLTLIVTSHQLDSALRIADRLVLLLDRKAVWGSPEEMASSTNQKIVQFLRPDESVTPWAEASEG